MAPTAQTNGYHITSDAATTVGRPVDDTTKLWTRYEASKYGDSAKNQLIEDVITHYESLMREHEDHVEQNKASERMREHVKILESNVLRMQRILNRDPHILVLIDGDGMIFNSSFLQQGAAGGKQAATLLSEAVTRWASTNIPDYPPESKVMVRVYANLQGLAEACARAGMVDHFAKVEDFARGFTCSGTLLDFTDVGSGNHGAQAKVNEMFKLFLYNYHCRQIVLGCSNHSSYVRLLEQYKNDEEALPRVAMLEGPPFDSVLNDLPFRKVKLSSIFCESKGSIGQMYQFSGQRVDSRISLSATSEVFTPRTTTPSLRSPFSSVTAAPREEMRPPPKHMRTDSITSSGNTSDNNASTWATVTSKNKHRPLTDRLRRPSNEPVEPPIKRNRAGQRIDIPGDYDRDEVQRVKKMKGCNQHYIGMGCCHYNAGRPDKCPHNHHYNFTRQELKTLRVVAKETPCKRGHECDDKNCIYGHMCPFPLATQGSMRGVGCLIGDDCRFPRSMHDMDTVPIRTIRAVGAF